MAFSTNLKYLRKKYGYSQDYIAEKMGYKSFTTIQKWESGIAEPSVAKLKQLATMFNVSMDQLLNEDLTIQEDFPIIGPFSKEESSFSSLSAKDERDITNDLDNIMRKIKNGDDGPLRYNGAEIDEQSLQLLESAINMSLRDLKITNKEKYNPNKNKK